MLYVHLLNTKYIEHLACMCMQHHASMCSRAHDPEEILRLKEEMSCCVQHYVWEHSE